MEAKAFPLGLGTSLKIVTSVDHQGYVLFIEIQRERVFTRIAVQSNTHRDTVANACLFSIFNPQAFKHISLK